MFRVLLSLSIASACMPGALLADTVLRYLPEPPPEGRSHGELTVYVSGGRVSLKGSSYDGVTHRTWFDAATDTVRVLDPYARGYYTLDKQSAQRLLARYRALHARIDARVAGYDTARIEDALSLVRRLENSEFGGGPATAMRYRDGEDSRASGYACSLVDVLRGGGDESPPERTLCVVEPGLVVADAGDAETLADLGAVSRAIAQTVSSFAERLPRFAVDLSVGVPVRVAYLDRDAQAQLVLDAVERVRIDDAEFTVPAEFDKRLPLRGLGVR